VLGRMLKRQAAFKHTAIFIAFGLTGQYSNTPVDLTRLYGLPRECKVMCER